MKNFFESKTNGFTLIELLVVIAIIAILAAILFPVFAQAREKARQTNCLSNVKQINLGIQQYLDDYDEMYPMYLFNGPGNYIQTSISGYPGSKFKVAHDSNDTIVLYTWMDAIFPYIKSLKIFDCPSNKNVSYLANYAINTDVTRFFWVDETLTARSEDTTPATIGMIKEPSSYVIVGEHYGWYPSLRAASLWAYSRDYVGSGAKGGKFFPHTDGMNVAFADGHSKWTKYDNAIFSNSGNSWWLNPAMFISQQK